MNLIFFASGFAGLIYESIWTHYLKLFLGHSAYAQTLVLAIFMGGMAVGAALAARRTDRISNPLAIYAAIEAAIGLLALAFHPLFTAATEGFYDLAFARHMDGSLFLALKWGLAVLLILPQSILLGATFPVFAAAATRQADAGKGRPIATLYFANSLGGALGVLASGFLFIPNFGLAGTIATAGAVNLVIVALVLRLAQGLPAVPARLGPAAGASPGSVPGLLLATSFLTGASSFIYEIGWIRMLSLVLGSATHSFELMLSSFILGLALGGLWIRRRIDAAANPGVLLGHIQIAMGCAAIATVPLHNLSFDLIAWTVAQAPKSEGGYALFNLVRYGVSSLIMFPAAFCAGMTLPLITRILYAQASQGEKAIGRVYSANTLGAIVGLAFAVHAGLPVLGLEYLVASGALVDVLLGAALLAVFGGRPKMRRAMAASLACVAGTAVTATTFDPQKMASGVFRTGRSQAEGKVLAIAHGRTATISVERTAASTIIRTNGKPDAAAAIGPSLPYHMDEVTMTLTGAIPLMLHQAPKRVANIGFGSGITGETILADGRVERLDTIEIEPKMVELARHFTGLNDKVFGDPRSAIQIDDAKSFFAANGRTYDLIVSEPSNPWVSGVSGLFSVEFYKQVGRYLNAGGIFAQWLQVYETDRDRVVSVLKAVDLAFDDYLVLALDHGDLLIVARPHGQAAFPADAYARLPAEVRQKLRRIEVANQSDVAYRVIGNKNMFRPWLDSQAVPPNSDYSPYLDSHAERDRFLGRSWKELLGLAFSPYPLAETLARRPPLPAGEALSINSHFGPEPLPLAARLARERLAGPASAGLPIPGGLPEKLMRQGDEILADCRNPPLGDAAFAASRLALRILPFLPPADGRSLLAGLGEAACLQGAPGAAATWPGLLRQVAERNAAGFGTVAEQLLASGPASTEARSKYLLGMAALGQVGAGNGAAARAVWARFEPAGAERGSLALEIIRAHALAAAPAAGPAARR